MADEAAILSEHAAAVDEIVRRCQAALASPRPAEMIHVSHAAQLARLQGETAGKLGQAAGAPAFAERFAAEEKRLREMCGL